MSCSESRTVTNRTGTLFDTLARTHMRTSAPVTSGTCQSSMKRSKLSRPAIFMASRPLTYACTSWPSSVIQRRRSASWSGSSSRIAMRIVVSLPGSNDTAIPKSYKEIMRIGLIGGGTIARLALERVRDALRERFEVVALMGLLDTAPRGRELAREFSVKYVESRDALLAAKPEAVIEAASHEAVRQHLVPLLEARIAVVVPSAGA